MPAGNLGTVSLKIVADISNYVKGVDTTLSKLGALQKEGGSKITQLGANLTKTGAGMKAMGTEMLMLGGAVAGGLALVVKSAKDFENAVIRASIETGKMGAELSQAQEKIKDVALTIGKDTVFSAKESANALGMLADVGFDVAGKSAEEYASFVDLANAGNVSLEESTATIIQTTKAFGLSLDDNAKIADVYAQTLLDSDVSMQQLSGGLAQLGTASRGAGLKFEEMASAIGTMVAQGVPAEQAGMNLKMAIATLSESTPAFTDTLAKLGLKLGDIDLRGEGLGKTLEKLSKAGATSETMLEIFGKRVGYNVNMLMEMDKSGQRAYLALVKMFEGGMKAGEASRQAGEAMKSFDNQLKLFMSSVDVLKIQLGTALLPKIQEVMEAVNKTMDGMVAWGKEHPKLAQSIGTLVVQAGLLSLAIGGIMLVFGSVFSLTGKLITGFMNLSLWLGNVALAMQGVQFTAGVKGATFWPTAYGALLVALVVTVGITIGKFLELQKALKSLNEEGQKLMDDSTRNLGNYINKTKELYKADIETNERMKTLAGSLDNLNRERLEYMETAMQNGKLNEAELRHLSNLEGQIISVGQSMKTWSKYLDEVAQLEGKATTAHDSETVSIEKKAVAMDKESVARRQQIADLSSSSNVMAEADRKLLSSIIQTTDATNVATEAKSRYFQAIVNQSGAMDAEAEGFFKNISLTQELTNREEELIRTQDALGWSFLKGGEIGKDFGMTLDELANSIKDTDLKTQDSKAELDDWKKFVQDIVDKDWTVRVNFKVEGSREYVSLQQEIQQLEQDIILQRTTGFERQRLELQFELEQFMMAMGVKRETRRIEHEEYMAQMKENHEALVAEFNASEQNAEQTKKMADVEKEYQDRVARTTEVQAGIMKGYDKVIQLRSTLTTMRLEDAKAVWDAQQAELKLGKDIVTSNQEQGLSYTELAQRKRDASMAYSTPFSGPQAGSSTRIGGTFSNPINYGSMQEASADASRPMGSFFKVSGYQGGTESVPRTGLYRLHEGEKVTPRGMVGGQGMQVTIINKIDSGFIGEVLDNNPNTIINIIGSDIARGGSTKKTILSMMRGR